MNKEIKEEWLKRLRSGDYKQAQEALCRVDTKGNKSYCCLGILSEIVNGEDSWESTELSTKGIYTLATKEGTCTAYPSKETIQAAGFGEDRPIEALSYDGESFSYQLAYANDEGKTFPEIADIIDEYV